MYVGKVIFPSFYTVQAGSSVCADQWGTRIFCEAYRNRFLPTSSFVLTIAQGFKEGGGVVGVSSLFDPASYPPTD